MLFAVVRLFSMGQDRVMGKSQVQSSGGAVWDLPLRLFHWILVAAVITSFVSIKTENMFIHEKSGLTILGLLGFRLIWGIVGSPHARFARFVKSPAAVMAYISSRVSGDRRYHPGHAPTGGYATVIILLSLLLMASLGLMANDDVFYDGPLAAWAGEFSGTASIWHRRLEKLMIAIVAMHLLAMVFYRLVLGQKLIPPMITGGHDPDITPYGWRHQVVGCCLMVMTIALAQYLGYDSTRFY